MLALIAKISPYKQRSDGLLALLCQLVILVNLQLAILLKGLTEQAILAELQATSSGDVEGVVLATRDRYASLAHVIGAVLVVLCVLPAIVVLVMLAWESTSNAARDGAASLAASSFGGRRVRVSMRPHSSPPGQLSMSPHLATAQL